MFKTVNPAALRTDFDSVVRHNGQPIRLRYYSVTYSGAEYDQEFITASGTDAWVYGMAFPLDINTGGADRKYFEQGLILLNDRKIFLPGSIELNSRVKIFTGSPTATLAQTFAPIENGWMDYNISGVAVYYKVYIRNLQNGSFIGEY